MDKEKIEEAKERFLKVLPINYEYKDYPNRIVFKKDIETILQYIDELEKIHLLDTAMIEDSISKGIVNKKYISKQKIKDRYEQLKHYDYIETRELIKLLEE